MTNSRVLRFTITGSYEVNPDDYECGDDPAAMAAIDQDEIDAAGVSVGDVIEWSADRDLQVKIEPAS